MHFMNLVKYVQVAVILLAAVAFAAASDYPAAPYEADYNCLFIGLFVTIYHFMHK